MNNKAVHWIAAIVFYGVPLIVGAHIGTDITVGTILNALYLWASHIVIPTERI